MGMVFLPYMLTMAAWSMATSQMVRSWAVSSPPPFKAGATGGWPLPHSVRGQPCSLSRRKQAVHRVVAPEEDPERCFAAHLLADIPNGVRATGAPG